MSEYNTWKEATTNEICVERLLFRKKRAEMLPVYRHRESTWKRVIYVCEEQSSFSTVDIFKRAICFYASNTLQADDGEEFTHTSQTKRVYLLVVFCNKYRLPQKLF